MPREKSVPRRLASGMWKAFTRTKDVDIDLIQETQLKRCLSVVDLTALGVGSTLGAGIYVITGQVAKNQAGPAVVISFLVAAVASFLAGICYAEFAARVPRAGSAYVYSYVSVGELAAFVIGWNMILENMIGAASVGKAWSEYFDSLTNDTIRTSIESHVGTFRSPGLGEFPDLLAFCLLVVCTLMISLGVKMSSVISFVFTILNLLVIIAIIAIGAFKAKGRNWTDPPGFFPFGFRGVLSGAATCFYAFVGFDTIATSGEEAKRPTHNIPTAIVTTLVICFLAYFGVSAVVTLMVPWYQLADTATLPKVFAQRGVIGAEYVIAVGGLCGLTASMMGSIFPLPRTIYAMAQDGLIFRWLGVVSETTNTPFLATWIAGLLAAILALLLDLDSLIQMMSIGTLMAYTLVAVSVLVLHYQSQHVGLCAADVHEDLDMIIRDTSDLSLGTMHKIEERASSVEDTGLLRVGENVNVVRYVPSNETTVFKRVDGENGNAQSHHSDAVVPGSSSSKPKREVVEEVRKKQERQILTRMAKYMSGAQTPEESSTYKRMDSNYSLSSIGQFFNMGDDNVTEPTEHTRRVALISLVLVIVLWTALCCLTVYGEEYIASAEWWAIILLCLLLLAIIGLCTALSRQPKNSVRLNFKVPFVPLIPLGSVMINIYLMITLSTTTWIRFGVWMTLGLLIYFCYGVRQSNEKKPEGEEREVILYDIADGEGMIVDGAYR